MQGQEKVITTTLTFDYFKASKRGAFARCVHTSVVEVFGVAPESCFEEDENGEQDLREDLARVIYPFINHRRFCEKSDYHTVSWKESKRPKDWFERIEESDEGEAVSLPIDNTDDNTGR